MIYLKKFLSPNIGYEQHALYRIVGETNGPLGCCDKADLQEWNFSKLTGKTLTGSATGPVLDENKPEIVEYLGTQSAHPGLMGYSFFDEISPKFSGDVHWDIQGSFSPFLFKLFSVYETDLAFASDQSSILSSASKEYCKAFLRDRFVVSELGFEINRIQNSELKRIGIPSGEESVFENNFALCREGRQLLEIYSIEVEGESVPVLKSNIEIGTKLKYDLDSSNSSL